MCAKSLQLCLTLCDSMDYSMPDSSVHGIFQVRILEWVALPSWPWVQVFLIAMPSWPWVFLTQGLNPCLLYLLHWQEGSLSLIPPGKPSSSLLEIAKYWLFYPAFNRDECWFLIETNSTSWGGTVVRNPPANAEDISSILDWKDSLE